MTKSDDPEEELRSIFMTPTFESTIGDNSVDSGSPHPSEKPPPPVFDLEDMMISSKKKEMIIIGAGGRRGVIDVTEMDTLADVRSLIAEQWDDDLKVPNFIFCVNDDDVQICTNQETLKLAWDFVDKNKIIRLESRPSSTRAEEVRSMIVDEDDNDNGDSGDDDHDDDSRSTIVLYISNQNTSTYANIGCMGFLNFFLEAVIGLTMPVWSSVHAVKCDGTSTLSPCEWLMALFRAAFFSIIFLADLADAIVDLYLGFRTAYGGSDGDQFNGYLLFAMTIVGRLVSGLYGLATPYMDDTQDRTFGFCLMEISVFMMEDGATILLLANSPKNDFLTIVSAWLSGISGLFVYYAALYYFGIILRNGCGLIKLMYVGGTIVASSYMIFTLWSNIILSDYFDGEIFSDGVDEDSAQMGALKFLFVVGSIYSGLMSVTFSLFCMGYLEGCFKEVDDDED